MTETMTHTENCSDCGCDETCTAPLPPDVTQATGEASTENAQLSYRYRDVNLAVIWHTSAPKDNEAALAYFHVVTRFGKEYNPVYVERITRDANGENEKVTTLRWMFDPETAQTKPLEL